MSLRTGSGKEKGVWLAILAVAVVIVCAVNYYRYVTVYAPVARPAAHGVAVSPKPAVLPVTAQSRMAVFGNTFWGRYTNDWSMASPLKTVYPFSRLNEFHRDQYDAWITGLECPAKSGVHMTSAEMEAALQFNCDPSYLPEAAKWFTAVTLANNHTDNQGEDGFKETQKNLEANKIQHFGHYDPRKLDEVCDVLAIPTQVTMKDGSVEKGQLPMAFCGFHGVFRIPPDESMAVMERYSKVMPVFAMPHMGLEYQPAPDALKTATYHKMIDHGADAVLGDHPHWVQNTEVYNGHLIVYSMGNFMFDQQDNAEVVRSAGIKVNVAVGEIDPAVLKQWLDIGATCATYHDTCLEKIEQQKLAKLPVTIKFGVVGTKDDGKITHPATVAETDGILKRLNWAPSMVKLQAPYGSL
jgi:poly-gamma-glutamate synthesis protein (capsule biosynthesis protein)